MTHKEMAHICRDARLEPFVRGAVGELYSAARVVEDCLTYPDAWLAEDVAEALRELREALVACHERHEVVKCGCGIGYTIKEFRDLPGGKVQTFGDGEIPWGIEMRHCSCGSTRAIGVDESGNLCQKGS